jgi:hypothetical protein
MTFSKLASNSSARSEQAEGSESIASIIGSFPCSARKIDDPPKVASMQVRYDACPFHPETANTREPLGSQCADGLCLGEPESEIHFLIEEQRESRLATGFLPFRPAASSK